MRRVYCVCTWVRTVSISLWIRPWRTRIDQSKARTPPAVAAPTMVMTRVTTRKWRSQRHHSPNPTLRYAPVGSDS